MDSRICKNCSDPQYSDFWDWLQFYPDMYIRILDLRKKYYKKLKELKNARKRKPKKKRGKKNKKGKKGKCIYDLPKDIIIKIILMIRESKIEEYKEKAFPGLSCNYCKSILNLTHGALQKIRLSRLCLFIEHAKIVLQRGQIFLQNNFFNIKIIYLFLDLLVTTGEFLINHNKICW